MIKFFSEKSPKKSRYTFSSIELKITLLKPVFHTIEKNKIFHQKK